MPDFTHSSSPRMSQSITESEAMGKTYDAIIIPGGGLEPSTRLPQKWVQARLDAAITLSSRTKYFVVLSRGTTHRPPLLDTRGFPILESAASARYLMEHGINDPQRILLDGWSLDTIGNAFFARSMICEPMQLKKCCIITSSFHMPRTRAIFDWVCALDGGRFELDYYVTPDVGLDDAQSTARIEKERDSLMTLQEKTIPHVNTLEKLSAFLLQEHGAYNAQAILANVAASNDTNSANEAIRSTY